MKDYLFCFDIDGTLRNNKDHQVSNSTILALNKLKQLGYKVIISTGRSVDSMLATNINKAFTFDGYVCNNGQAVLDKDLNPIYTAKIDSEIVKQCINVAKENKIPLALKTTPRILIGPVNDNVINSAKFFNNPIPTPGEYHGEEVGAMIAYGDLNHQYEEFKIFNELDVMPGESTYADITIRGISKATGIKKLQELMNKDKYVAFGDSLNDVEMFKHATYSICMGQGNNYLKSIASYVTDDIYHDGIYNACIHLGYIK